MTIEATQAQVLANQQKLVDESNTWTNEIYTQLKKEQADNAAVLSEINELQAAYGAYKVLKKDYGFFNYDKPGLSSHVKKEKNNLIGKEAYYKNIIIQNERDNEKISYAINPKKKGYFYNSNEMFRQLYLYAVQSGKRDENRTIRFAASKINQPLEMVSAGTSVGAKPPQIMTHDGKQKIAMRNDNGTFTYDNDLVTTLGTGASVSFNPNGINLLNYLGDKNIINVGSATSLQQKAELLISYHRVSDAVNKITNLSSVSDAHAILGMVQEIALKIDEEGIKESSEDAIIANVDPVSESNNQDELGNWDSVHKKRYTFTKPEEVERTRSEWYKKRKEAIFKKLEEKGELEKFKENGELREDFKKALDPLMTKNDNSQGINAHVIRGAMTEAGISFLPQCLKEAKSKREADEKPPVFYLQDKASASIDLVSFSGVHEVHATKLSVRDQEVLDNLEDYKDHITFAQGEFYGNKIEDQLKLKEAEKVVKFNESSEDKWKMSFDHSFYVGKRLYEKNQAHQAHKDKVKTKVEERAQLIEISNALKALDQANKKLKNQGKSLNDEELKVLKKYVCEEMSKKVDGSFKDFNAAVKELSEVNGAKNQAGKNSEEVMASAKNILETAGKEAQASVVELEKVQDAQNKVEETKGISVGTETLVKN